MDEARRAALLALLDVTPGADAAARVEALRDDALQVELERALEAESGDRAAAARAMGVPLSTVQRMLLRLPALARRFPAPPTERPPRRKG